MALQQMRVGAGNGVAFIFNVIGEYLASNDNSLKATDGNGNAAKVASVSNAVITSAMSFLLARAGVSVTNYTA